MTEEVDYESDTAMAVEEEDEEPKPSVQRPETKRIVKGRGSGAAAMDVRRYPAQSGVFETFQAPPPVALATRDHANALRSVEGWLVFVTGVHEEAQEDDVLDVFAEHAQVTAVHLNLDRRSGFVKGYALVAFEHFVDAKAAIERLDGHDMLGSVLHVDWAFERQEEEQEGRRRRRPRGRMK
uniref:RRM domain-containing protein n=1 Tax=Peronospora matthiolae TaxID=2874970 RepID=A0AAV1US12_9STRA